MTEQNDIFELFQEMVSKNPKLFPHEEKKEKQLLIRNSNLEHLQEKKKEYIGKEADNLWKKRTKIPKNIRRLSGKNSRINL